MTVTKWNFKPAAEKRKGEVTEIGIDELAAELWVLSCAGPGDGFGDRIERIAARLREVFADRTTSPPEESRIERHASEPSVRKYGKQYTLEQRAWCERYERETTFEPLMCDFEAGNESFISAAKNSRAWFENWSGDALHRGCDNIPGEMAALYREFTGERYGDN